MVQVKFNTYGANSAFGSFGPGDTMRCSEAMAKHLVDEIGCAVYVESKAKQVAADSAPAEAPKKRGKKD